MPSALLANHTGKEWDLLCAVYLTTTNCNFGWTIYGWILVSFWMQFLWIQEKSLKICIVQLYAALYCAAFLGLGLSLRIWRQFQKFSQYYYRCISLACFWMIGCQVKGWMQTVNIMFVYKFVMNSFFLRWM